MHWLIPLLDVCWGIFTLLQYRVQSYAELMAYRFMVGWFEVSKEQSQRMSHSLIMLYRRHTFPRFTISLDPGTVAAKSPDGVAFSTSA
jgi:hypothetical protein